MVKSVESTSFVGLNLFAFTKKELFIGILSFLKYKM